MEVVEDEPLQPDGIVQEYDVAPETAPMLYVQDCPVVTFVSPEIAPGWEGIAVTDTLNVLDVEVPQELFAVTDIVPPLAPAVAVIEVVVDDPLHPEGNVQVYDVAPDTASMLQVCDDP